MCNSSIIFPLLLLLICSCEKSRTDNPLLNGHEYKLWYIIESSDNNPEFIYIDCYNIFYVLEFNKETEYFSLLSDTTSPHYNLFGKWNYDSDTTIYLNNILYNLELGCDTFTFESHDIWDAGYPEPVYYDYYYQTLFLRNEHTNENIKLRDTKLPLNLYTYQSKEKDIEHYQKWGKKIKKALF